MIRNLIFYKFFVYVFLYLSQFCNKIIPVLSTYIK